MKTKQFGIFVLSMVIVLAAVLGGCRPSTSPPDVAAITPEEVVKGFYSPLVVRLIATARTFAMASVAVAAVGPPLTGSGGAGVLIFEGMRLLDYAQMLRGFAIVVLLALVVDVLLGALQWLFYRLFFQHLWEPCWRSSVRSARRGDPSVVAPLNQI
jgi:ABC-type proline/glycine betaine transport system permease subunit